MTKAISRIHASGSGYPLVGVWYLMNPSPGLTTISVVLGGITFKAAIIHVEEWSGVDPADPIGATNSNENVTGDVARSLIPEASGNVVIAVQARRGATAAGPYFTPDSSVTEVTDEVSGTGGNLSDIKAWVGYYTTVGTSAVNVGATETTGTTNQAWAAAEFRAGAATIVGTLAKTEAPDTLASAGSLSIKGVLSQTNAVDTLAAGGSLSITGVLAATNAADTLAAAGSSGTGVISGTLAKTEAPDTLVATGTAVTGGVYQTGVYRPGVYIDYGNQGQGTLARAEAPDTLSATGNPLNRGSLAVAEAPDTLVAADILVHGGVYLPGVYLPGTYWDYGAMGAATLAVTEAPDTLAAAGKLSIRGALARTEAPDTVRAADVAAFGGVYLAGVYRAGVYLDYGQVGVGVGGGIEAPDTLAATGKLSIRGILTKAEAPDTLVASSAGAYGGVYLPGVYLPGVYQGVGSPAHGVLAKTEAPDILVAHGRVPIKGVLAKTEAPDTLIATLFLVVVAPPDIHGPVGDRIYIVESLFTTTFYLPPGVDPPPPSATASWEGTAAFPVAGRGFEAEAVGVPTLPPYDFRVANIDFTTRPSDPDRPSAWWDGRLIDPGDLTRAISLTSVGAGSVESSGGTIVIDNTDGIYDSVLDDSYAVSQNIAVRQADPSANWIDFETLWHMRITGISISETELTLEVEEPVSYAQNFFPATYYNGLGGIAGDASLLNVQRPIVLGRVWNYKPILIDPVKLIYQMHDGPIIAVNGVFDGGAALTYHASYATYALLAAATIPAGKYGQCDSEGVIRLGGTPARDVTVHIDGHASAGIHVRSIASWLATQLEPQIWVDIETAAFDLLPPYSAGWVWTEPFSYQEALSRFVGDVGWVWGSLRPGPMTVGQLLPPDNTAIVREFDEVDILKLERLSLPAGYESTHHRRIVRYQKNWTVQPQSVLVATAVESTFRQQEWKTVFANSGLDARNALDAPVLDTSLQASSTAQVLADALIDLHGARRKLFSLQTKIYGEVPPLTSNVLVTYPRFGLDGGVPFRVISLQHNYREGLATMLLWG